jgi:hypothetical protein
MARILLIAPEGIEITEKNGEILSECGLLIAPEGIEMK